MNNHTCFNVNFFRGLPDTIQPITPDELLRFERDCRAQKGLSVEVLQVDDKRVLLVVDHPITPQNQQYAARLVRNYRDDLPLIMP